MVCVQIQQIGPKVHVREQRTNNNQENFTGEKKNSDLTLQCLRFKTKQKNPFGDPCDDVSVLESADSAAEGSEKCGTDCTPVTGRAKQWGRHQLFILSQLCSHPAQGSSVHKDLTQ